MYVLRLCYEVSPINNLKTVQDRHSAVIMERHWEAMDWLYHSDIQNLYKCVFRHYAVVLQSQVMKTSGRFNDQCASVCFVQCHVSFIYHLLAVLFF